MKKIIITGVIGISVLAVNCKTNEETGASHREGRQERGMDPFTEMDTNKDGILTKAEVKGPLAKDFSKIDLDNDGVITRAEFDKAPKPQRGENGGGRPPRN